MHPTSPVREVNRRLHLSLHEDGIPDLLAGILVANFALIPLLDGTGMSPGLRQVILLSIYFLQIGILILVRQHITRPRAGTVVLTKARRNRPSFILLLTNIILFISIIVLYFFRENNTEFLEHYGLFMILGGVFLVLLSTAGLILKAGRFYVYGMVVAGLFMAGGNLYLHEKVADYGIPFAGFLAGGLIFLSGIWRLIRFLRTHPKDPV